MNGDLWTIDDARTHIQINFDDLRQLKSGTSSELPNTTIRGLRGIDAHWIDSRDVLERLIREHELPNGVYLKKTLDHRQEKLSDGEVAPTASLQNRSSSKSCHLLLKLNVS